MLGTCTRGGLQLLPGGGMATAGGPAIWFPRGMNNTRLITGYMSIAALLITVIFPVFTPYEGDFRTSGIVALGAGYGPAWFLSVVLLGYGIWALSKRSKSETPTDQTHPLGNESSARAPESGIGLLPGTCSCTKWERGLGGTGFVGETPYCVRCLRALH